MRVGTQTDETTDAPDLLPDGTKHCVVVCGDVKVTTAKRYAEYLPNDLELEENDSRGTNPSVTFEPGDEVPLEIARDAWKAFADRVACFDGHGTRKDRKANVEKITDGTERIISQFKRDL